MTEKKAKQTQSRLLEPPVDIYEDDNCVMLYADMPGVSQDNLHVQIEGRTLTLEGVISLPTTETRDYEEVQAPYFSRSFTLGELLDSDNIQADFKDGVLALMIPKQEQAKPRRIEIRSE